MTSAAQTQTLRIERILDATPEEVWAAWTQPEQYAKWISPFPGRAVELHEFDARVGGRVRFTMVGTQGERYPEASFIYEKLDRPREIVTFEANENRPDVFDGHPMRATVRFEPLPGGKTRVRFEQAGLPAVVPLDMARQGFGACFDKLATLLAGGSP